MNFSDQWRSLWPISSVFPAPNLLSSSPFGPLLFLPSQSPPHLLLSSPSLSPHFPPSLPPSSLLHSLFFSLRSPLYDSFLPSSSLHSLASDLVHPLPSPSDPFFTNNLHALRCRRSSNVLLFFPTGENGHHIGFLSISFQTDSPELLLDRNQDVFRQSQGFKHPYHRILKLSVIPASVLQSEISGNSVVEGFLIAVTLYSVNWFRVETRVSDSGGREMPVLVPLAKQGFEASVVDACWSPHLPEESAVLLDSGELCWFDLESKRGGRVRVTVDGRNPGGWLRCDFGWHPSILFVACSSAVVLVDLRLKKGVESKVLARVKPPDFQSTASFMEKTAQILAFCRAGFDSFQFAVVTEHQLLVFDARQPLFPSVTWKHGLHQPRCVSMYRLSELRPSEEFKRASSSGFVVLVGSFWNDEFNLFFYGPNERESFGSCSLYAWGLPSRFPLSGRGFISGDDLVREMFLEGNCLSGSEWKQTKDVVVGFWIAPNDLLNVESESSGFALIRLRLSGKLELQRYHASGDFSHEKVDGKGEGLLEYKDSAICYLDEESRVSTRRNFFKFTYLREYINGNLSNALAMNVPRLNHKGVEHNSCNYHLRELTSNKLTSSNSLVSDFISDATVPTSIFEIACRRVLSSLHMDLLPQAFSKYSDLGGYRVASIAFLEVPSRLPHHRLPPFFVGKPSRRNEKVSKKSLFREALVGPVLPLPVLLALQEMNQEKENSSSPREESMDDLLTHQCKQVLENVYPEISLADSGNSSVWGSSQELQGEKSFFVYEPSHIGNRSAPKETNGIETCRVKEELAQMDRTCLETEDAYKDEKFATFICGIADKTCDRYSGCEEVGVEFLDLSPVRLDFDSSPLKLQPVVLQSLTRLKGQFSKWQGRNTPFQDFCSSSKLPK